MKKAIIKYSIVAIVMALGFLNVGFFSKKNHHSDISLDMLKVAHADNVECDSQRDCDPGWDYRTTIFFKTICCDQEWHISTGHWDD